MGLIRLLNITIEQGRVPGDEVRKGSARETQFLEEDEFGFEGLLDFGSQQSGELRDECFDVGVFETAVFEEFEH